MRSIEQKKYPINESLLCIYLLLPSLLRWAVKANPSLSFAILAATTIFILIASFIYNFRKKHKLNPSPIIIILIVFILFSISLLLNDNSIVFQYLHDFLIFGAVNIILFSKIENWKLFFRIGAVISVVNLLLYIQDPLNGYELFDDYMNYGLMCVLPTFYFCIMSRMMENSKRFLLFEIISMVLLVVFCNRGAALTAVIMEAVAFMGKMLSEKNSIKKIAITAMLILTSFIFVVNIDHVLESTLSQLKTAGVQSYSLKTISQVFQKRTDGLSGRDQIWDSAISSFNEFPILGRGIGYFHSKYGIYPHNLLLETATSFGLLGVIALLIIIIKYVTYCKASSNNARILLYINLVMAIIPLLFSIHMFKWPYYWSIVYIAVNKTKLKHRK